jgi:hypothetical protein
MNQKNTLILIDANTEVDTLKSNVNNPKSTFTLFLPTKRTKEQEYKAVEALRTQLDIPEENHLTINISSIIQKTWRIINHYSGDTPTLIKKQPEGVYQPITPEEIEKTQPQRSTHIQALAKLNHTRLSQIETFVRDLITKDQATKLNAEIITPK